MASRVPSLNWLRVFEAAARTESFARAAAQLGMSAAAVSQQVKALEDHVGAPLFQRGARNVTLTDVGRAYLPSVAQALGLLEGATEGLFGAARETPVFIQSVLLYAHGNLAPALGAFTAAHPQVRVTLSTGNIPEDFDRGYHDLRIVFGPPDRYGGTSVPLLGETLFPIATPAIAARFSGAQKI